MTSIPQMDPRLSHAVQCSLNRAPGSLYDLKKVKILNDFSYCGDPYYQTVQPSQEPEDFSAIGSMENLHTLMFGTPRSQSIPTVLVRDFSFLVQCKKLKKLDLRWTNFTDCTLLLQLPALRQVHLPPKAQLTGLEVLDELAGHGVVVELPPAYVPLEVRQPARGSEPVRAVVEEIKKRTATDCYRLTVQPGSLPGLFDSKFGGFPYWDPALPYPVDSAGEKMVLLAQINFDQFPADDPLPQGGMLQFFIGQDNCFGLDRGFQVVYHQRIDLSVTPQQLKPLDIPTHKDTDYFLVMESAAVTMEKTTACMGPADGRFDALFAQVWKDVTGQAPPEDDFRDFLEEPDRDFLYDQLWSSGHHLLGWPCFEQFDPREENSPYDTLLFQLDSDWTETETYVMWGDGGVGGFFLNGEKLKNRDFSDVFYTWDCG